MSYKKSWSENFCSAHKKKIVLESHFNKVTELDAWNFIEKILQHRRFFVNIAKFLRRSILKNICERLLVWYDLRKQLQESRGVRRVRCVHNLVEYLTWSICQKKLFSRKRSTLHVSLDMSLNMSLGVLTKAERIEFAKLSACLAQPAFLPYTPCVP